jgi:hypothetical protein
MAATLELKYYNSFWLKKLASVTAVQNTTAVTANDITTNILTITIANASIAVGQAINWTKDGTDYVLYVSKIIDPTHVLMTGAPAANTLLSGTKLNIGPIQDFTHVPAAYAANDHLDWYIEESRIKGGYNNVDVDLGVQAFIVEPEAVQRTRPNALIYSGPFNSRTGVNNTNQFSVGEDITVAVDPANGSIQKLFAEDTNLTIFQELKVSRALIDKDAVYSAEGTPLTTSGAVVIGQVQAYAGNYGISMHPESFAVFGYRKYFVDSNQGLVLRLSQDGITEISGYGMRDYFRKALEGITNDALAIGGWDQHSKQYVLSLQPVNGSYDFDTLSFDEDSNGWSSFWDYKPEAVNSLRNYFYSFKEGNIWKHFSPDVSRGTFYGSAFDSSITSLFNAQPSVVKSFKTLNYEGDAGWVMSSLVTDNNLDSACSISAAPASGTITTLSGLQNQLLINNFKQKENKYFANLFNISTVTSGEVVYGQSISGVKGFWSTVVMSVPAASPKTEMFAISSDYVESSY